MCCIEHSAKRIWENEFVVVNLPLWNQWTRNPKARNPNIAMSDGIKSCSILVLEFPWLNKSRLNSEISPRSRVTPQLLTQSHVHTVWLLDILFGLCEKNPMWSSLVGARRNRLLETYLNHPFGLPEWCRICHLLTFHKLGDPVFKRETKGQGVSQLWQPSRLCYHIQLVAEKNPVN